MDSYLKKLFEQTLDVCSPQKAVSGVVSMEGDHLMVDQSSYSLTERPVHVFSVGKAAVPMFQALHDKLGDRIAGSLVITTDSDNPVHCTAGEIIQGAHPVPNDQSLHAGMTGTEFLGNIPDDAIVFTLISGGTSSLMCLPAEGISISDLNQTFELLNHSGAGIYDMNAVRKHCSRIKGGQLLRFLPVEATLIDLIISDVPGDDPAVIGSGPTTPDTSTFSDAHRILAEYNVWEKLPIPVRHHIEKGKEEEVPETLKPGENPVKEHQTHIVSSAGQFVRRAAAFTEDEGYDAWVADEPYNEAVDTVVSNITAKIKDRRKKQQKKPTILMFYGESTVKVTGDGKGGRNQELALRGALEIAGQQNISWLSAGTDGVDGPTDAAGALVNNETIYRARQRDIGPEDYLQNNDSYHFHEQMGTLLKTGPTGNNLMDVVFVKIG